MTGRSVVDALLLGVGLLLVLVAFARPLTYGLDRGEFAGREWTWSRSVTGYMTGARVVEPTTIRTPFEEALESPGGPDAADVPTAPQAAVTLGVRG